MTENQITEMFRLMNTAIGKITNLENDMSEVKSDIAELKVGQARLEAGQARLEKELQITNRAFDRQAGEAARVQARVELLEQRAS